MIYIIKIENGTKVFINRVIDGDTVCFMIEDKEISIRLDGVDAPETRKDKRDPSRTDKHILAGKKVGEYLRSILEGKIVELHVDEKYKEKYGRVLAKILLNNINISEHLVSLGYGKNYNGKGDKEWKSYEIDMILNEDIFKQNLESAKLLFKQDKIEYTPILMQKLSLNETSLLEPLLYREEEEDKKIHKYDIIEKNNCLSCVFDTLICCFGKCI